MARSRSPNYDDQRDMILAHAARLFAERGYPATSMNQVSEACKLSKASIYYYFPDKYNLLVHIADGHVSRLVTCLDEKKAATLGGEERLRFFIHRIVDAYADARYAHHVLTEDVRFLTPEDRERVLQKERHLVEAFAVAIAEARPALQTSHLAKPLTMLLFGMVNWMFTWVRSDGPLTHAQLGPIVADLFIGGLKSVSTEGLPERLKQLRNSIRRGPAARSNGRCLSG